MKIIHLNEADAVIGEYAVTPEQEIRLTALLETIMVDVELLQEDKLVITPSLQYKGL